MRITFLGTGTSQGVPMIACDCAVCTSTDVRNKRTRPSIYVETADAKFVVDVTPDFRVQCLANDVRRLDAVVITHTHADHILGLDDVRRFNHLQGGAIPLFAEAKAMEDLQRIFGYAFSEKSAAHGWVQLTPRVIEGAFTIGGATLTPLPVSHGHMMVIGFLIKDADGSAFAYITDAKEVPASVEAQIRGVPLLILNALRHRPHPAHMTVAESVATVQRIRPSLTFFTHLTHELEHVETNRGLPEGVELGFDGLRLEVKGREVRKVN